MSSECSDKAYPAQLSGCVLLGVHMGLRLPLNRWHHVGREQHRPQSAAQWGRAITRVLFDCLYTDVLFVGFFTLIVHLGLVLLCHIWPSGFKTLISTHQILLSFGVRKLSRVLLLSLPRCLTMYSQTWLSATSWSWQLSSPTMAVTTLPSVTIAREASGSTLMTPSSERWVNSEYHLFVSLCVCYCNIFFEYLCLGVRMRKRGIRWCVCVSV